LDDGELKQQIEAYARAVKFPLKQILVMDGSRRSSKSNAFFTGFGQHRRIVLYDTLVQKHSLPELMAILAHEMGHYKLHHTLTATALRFCYGGVLLFTMASAMEWPPLSAAFGLEPSLHTGLLGLVILFTPANRIFSIAMNRFSRKNEFAADRFAAATSAEPQAMVDALIRLSRDNYSHLNPHPIWVWLTYSHPPILERIKAITRHSPPQRMESQNPEM
jgi:STE24 endopeptidase